MLAVILSVLFPIPLCFRVDQSDEGTSLVRYEDGGALAELPVELPEGATFCGATRVDPPMPIRELTRSTTQQRDARNP